MSNALIKVLPRLLLVAGVVVAWLAGMALTAGTNMQLANAEQQIAENEDLKTYKNVISLYDEVIAAHPDDIDWYKRKAVAYYELEEYLDYVAQCERIIGAFPEVADGYEMLMSYYDSVEDHRGVFDLYGRTPDSLKEADVIKDTYAKYEYWFSYLGGSHALVEPLSGGYGLVEDDGFFGYVSSEGRTVIDCVFDEARSSFGDGFAVKQDDEWFIVDVDGDRIHATHDKIEDLYSPNQGFALAKVGGVYGYYDDKLSKPQHFEYEGASVFCNGVAAVKQNGKWALIDSGFNLKTGFEFDDVIIDFSGACSRGSFVFAKKDGSYVLLDLDGNRIGNESFEDAQPAHGELMAVKQGGKWGFVGRDGAMVIDCSYEGADSFSNGLAPVEIGGAWGLIDVSGDTAIEPSFQKVFYLSANGVSAVDTGKSMRYIQFYKYSNEEEG